MAYAATVAVSYKGAVNGRETFLVTITETEAAAASEWSVTGLPDIGTITHYQATLTAGSGATINPILGKAASFSADTQNHIATNTNTAVHINDGARTPYTLQGGAGTIYGRSTVNAGADNSISTLFVVVEGHDTD